MYKQIAMDEIMIRLRLYHSWTKTMPSHFY